MTPILELPGIGPDLETKLAQMGISTAEQFAATSPTALLEIPGIGVRRVEILLEAARRVSASASKGLPKLRKDPVWAAASKASGDARAKVEDTVVADEVTAPAEPKKAAKGKDSKKVKAKNKSKDKKEAAKKKAKEKAAAAKKGKARKKDKKDRKSKKK